MNEGSASGQKDLGQEGSTSRGDWPFRAALILGVLLVAYILLAYGLEINKAFAANLPLLLPLTVTILSVFTRATEIRSVEGVLKMSNDLSIGIISFDIWAISASRSDTTGRIIVNPTTMIRGDFVLPFLLFGLLIAVGCVVLTRYEFQDVRTKHRWLLIGLVAAVLVYIAPFGALESIPQEWAPESPETATHQYTVAIPYKDPIVTAYAPAVLAERQFIQFERYIDAKTPSEAQKFALQRFLASPGSDQIRVRNRPRRGEKVIISQQEILVVEQ